MKKHYLRMQLDIIKGSQKKITDAADNIKSWIEMIELCQTLNISIEKHIQAKMEYNKTRSHKHGKAY